MEEGWERSMEGVRMEKGIFSYAHTGPVEDHGIEIVCRYHTAHDVCRWLSQPRAFVMD